MLCLFLSSVRDVTSFGTGKNSLGFEFRKVVVFHAKFFVSN